MKVIKIGVIIINILLIITLVTMGTNKLESETIRDVFISPALIISLYICFLILKKKTK